MQHFDVVVLGAGPGGYVAAIRAAQLGKSVAVVEHKWWGGVCLNVGCIPTKALLRNAELADLFTRRREEFGIEGEVRFSYGKAFSRSRAVADKMAKGVHFLMRKNNIAQFDGWGEFAGPRTLRVGEETLGFDSCIVATGATPKVLPGTELGERVWSYERLIMSEWLPASIVIAGSGAIGTEFAYVLANYGVRVVLVEFAETMLPAEDPEIGKELARHYRKLGVEVLTGTRVDTVQETGGGVRVTTSGGVLEAEAMLQAVGFAPRTAGFGLETTGVALDGRGAIAIDEAMRTNVAGIYAIGDVTGKLMLAHTAEAQGVIAAETIAGLPTVPIDYDMVPRATYCQPQVASFGLTEAKALDAGFDVVVAKFPFQANGKAAGLGESAGFVKVVADAEHGELLGAHMIGPDVTELLPELTLAQLWDLTAAEVARNIHAHPTLSEAVKEACEGIGGHMLNL
jgi:dihydrolipoamide dehydrogenase